MANVPFSEHMPFSRQVMAIEGGGDPVPEGAIPTQCVVVVSYMDSNGTIYRKWHTEGEPTLDEIFGMFEMVKMRMCADTYGWETT